MLANQLHQKQKLQFKQCQFYQQRQCAYKDNKFSFIQITLSIKRKASLSNDPPKMINNYIQYQYQPSHLIYNLPYQGKDNGIYLGDVSSALDMEFIEKSNIKTVVTAAANMDQVSYNQEENQHLNINHIVYQVLDSKNQNLIKFFDDFYQLVEKALQNGSMLVHCAAGISRSSTLVISYLMKKHLWSFKQAIKFVRDKRPIVLPNLGFERQLKQYQTVLFKQQHRRLKSKTSQSNKHGTDKEYGISNNLNLRQIKEMKERGQLLPEIGMIGQVTSNQNTSKNKKILDAFRIYKNKEQQLPSKGQLKQNILFSHHQNNVSNSSKNAYKIRMSNPSKIKEFSQSKSANLHNTRQGRRQDFSLSKKQLLNVNVNGLFDAAIIPIKYSSSGNKNQRLKKTHHLQFQNNQNYPNVGNNNANLNRINLLKQKYINNNGVLSVGQMAALQMNGHQFGNNLNLGEKQKLISSRGGINIQIPTVSEGVSRGAWDNKRKYLKSKEGNSNFGVGGKVIEGKGNIRLYLENDDKSRRAVRNQFINKINNY